MNEQVKRTVTITNIVKKSVPDIWRAISVPEYLIVRDCIKLFFRQGDIRKYITINEQKKYGNKIL